MKAHGKSGSLEPYGFWQEDFRDLISMATTVCIEIKFFERILNEPWQDQFCEVSSKFEAKFQRRFLEKKNDAWIDGQMHARTTDTWPLHKPVGRQS